MSTRPLFVNVTIVLYLHRTLFASFNHDHIFRKPSILKATAKTSTNARDESANRERRKWPIGAYIGPVDIATQISGSGKYGSKRNSMPAMAVDEKQGEDAVTAEKSYPMLEVRRHNSRRSCWFVVHGKVYDVTPFLDEHPGGDDILIDSAGRDATREFEDVGHSDSARAQLEKLVIGVLREPTEEELAAAPADLAEEKGAGVGATIMKWALPLLLVLLAWVVRKYTK